MIVCEFEFINEDKNHPGYSFTEIDMYAYIPAKFHAEHKNHRLTLWKNLKTNKYELVKVYMEQFVQPIQYQKGLGIIVTNIPTTEQNEIIFANESLEAVLIEAHGLWNKFHGSNDYERQVDEVCNHSKYQPHCLKRYVEEKKNA